MATAWVKRDGLVCSGDNRGEVQALLGVKGHGVTTIVEGDPTWLIDGIPVALEGHKTSCGASLISTLPAVKRAP